jgi:hypothetical protein
VLALHQQTSAVAEMTRAAGVVDPGAAEIWRWGNAQQVTDLLSFSVELRSRGWLRPGDSPREVARSLAVLCGHETYWRMVVQEKASPACAAKGDGRTRRSRPTEERRGRARPRRATLLGGLQWGPMGGLSLVRPGQHSARVGRIHRLPGGAGWLDAPVVPSAAPERAAKAAVSEGGSVRAVVTQEGR